MTDQNQTLHPHPLTVSCPARRAASIRSVRWLTSPRRCTPGASTVATTSAPT